MREPIWSKPELRGFLPLLYVAWADGDLGPEELVALQSRLAAEPWLSPEAQGQLKGWLEPTNPPEPDELQGLLREIRQVAGTLDPSARCTLAELGTEMARQARGEEPGEDERQALRALEDALGVVGTEACRALRTERRPRPTEERPEPSFDANAMRGVLDAPHGDARDQVRTFLAEPAHRPPHDLDRRAHREQVFRQLGTLAELCIGRLGYPGVTTEARDGALGDFLAAIETLSLGDLSLFTKFGVQFGLFGGSIYFLGDDAQRTRWLPDVADLRLPGCFAMSELGHGSNVMELETVARWIPEEGEVEIHTPSESARKEWIGNAALHGRMATVFAQLEVNGEHHGVHAFLVPIRGEDGEPADGVRIDDCGPKMGLEGVDNGRLWFNRVRVPRENLLARYGHIDANGRYRSPIPGAAKRFFTMLGTLVAGRLSVGAAGLSAARVGLAIAIRYGEARRQFGPEGGAEVPILDYRTHQRRLMPRLAEAYCLHFASQYLRDRFLARTEEDQREVEALAAGFKVIASRHAVDTLQVCRECCGGQGYLTINRLPGLRSDAEIFTTFEGDNTVLLQLVAKALLTGYRKQFQESRYLSVLEHVAKRARSAVADKNPIARRRTDEKHLRDSGYHLDLFRARERSLLTSVARRLKKRIDADVDGWEAMREVQDHLVSLATASIEREVLERTLEGIEACEEAPLREQLERLAALWAVWRIEDNAAWFLENGFFEASKVRSIRHLLNDLCSEVRRDARTLVDAFGIPDATLAAPIAFGDPADEPWKMEDVMTETEKKKRDDETEKTTEPKEEERVDKVTEAGEESFPASDPPSFTPEKTG